MPTKYKKVRFQTEYNSSFQGFDSDVYRSSLLGTILAKPAEKEVNKDKVAGLKSQKFLKTDEPPLQHKKHVSPSKTHGKSPTKLISSDKKVGERDVTTNNETHKRNKALEFKAGLRPAATVEVKRPPLSEYKRQFEWKKTAEDSSPLLNAEKIVFDSHTNIPRFVSDKIAHKTEYQSKFGPGKIRKLNKKAKENEVDIELETRETRQEEIPSNVKRLLQTSQNPDVPFFPHGSSRPCHSEYKANFGSPKKYKYKEGIWFGAKPPHLLPDEESSQGSNGSKMVTNWFVEVLELREKAKMYKIRAMEGNYFSREFLAKLDSELQEVLAGEESKKTPSNSKKGDGSESADGVVRQSGEQLLPCNVKHAWVEHEGMNNGEETPTRGESLKPTLAESLDVESFSSNDEAAESDECTSCSDSEPSSKQHLARTYNKRPSPTGPPNQQPVLAKTAKKESTLLHHESSGGDASSERSDDEEEIDSVSSKEGKEDQKKHDIDTFNIDSVKRMQSNDADLLSSSVQSIYGSNSDHRLDGDALSVSSFASSESLARNTLSHAKQRNRFWKK